jgi:hypothetical protein
MLRATRLFHYAGKRYEAGDPFDVRMDAGRAASFRRLYGVVEQSKPVKAAKKKAANIPVLPEIGMEDE